MVERDSRSSRPTGASARLEGPAPGHCGGVLTSLLTPHPSRAPRRAGPIARRPASLQAPPSTGRAGLEPATLGSKRWAVSSPRRVSRPATSVHVCLVRSDSSLAAVCRTALAAPGVGRKGPSSAKMPSWMRRRRMTRWASRSSVRAATSSRARVCAFRSPRAPRSWPTAGSGASDRVRLDGPQEADLEQRRLEGEPVSSDEGDPGARGVGCSQ
jgi:hypothetical protein